ncbi:glycosyltransferase family 4 protein, partial [Patescibacteria group bacterium]|nr:glycosyltransferase family 4 protein [Patescibacteria group bacterium]
RLSWRTASAVTAVSEDDAAVIEAYVNHPVPVVPNGVDIESFPFRLPKTAESPMILFVGNFRWHPNQDAAYTLVGRIWPRLQERIKNARLRIVGKDIPAKLRRMAEGVGGQVDENAEDIASVYRQADVLVAPHAISGGTKFKMLEAMASGLPIVTTKEGASGLAMKQGIHFLSADTPDGFVTAIAAICESDITRQALAKNGRKLVESRYNWDIIAKTLEGVWQKASHE